MKVILTFVFCYVLTTVAISAGDFSLVYFWSVNK